MRLPVHAPEPAPVRRQAQRSPSAPAGPSAVPAAPLTAEAMLGHQRAVGNAAVQRMLLVQRSPASDSDSCPCNTAPGEPCSCGGKEGEQ